MEITVRNFQKKILINPPRVQKTVRAILDHLKVKDASLSFVFVTHQKIQALNRRYLRRSYATDVLAFDLAGQKNARLEGDIFISTDAVIKNAQEFKTQPQKELTLYIVHGILHLRGYDDHAPADIKRMRAKEQEILRYLE